jgi:hypothetical protein
MAKTDNLGVPRVDEAVDLATVRDEAEEIAVPAFDYLGQPIEALVDGFTGHGHDFEHRNEDTQVEDRQGSDKSVEMSEDISEENSTDERR